MIVRSGPALAISLINCPPAGGDSVQVRPAAASLYYASVLEDVCRTARRIRLRPSGDLRYSSVKSEMLIFLSLSSGHRSSATLFTARLKARRPVLFLFEGFLLAPGECDVIITILCRRGA